MQAVQNYESMGAFDYYFILIPSRPNVRISRYKIRRSFSNTHDWAAQTTSTFDRRYGCANHFTSVGQIDQPVGICGTIIRSAQNRRPSLRSYAVFMPTLQWVKEGWIDSSTRQVYWNIVFGSRLRSSSRGAQVVRARACIFYVVRRRTRLARRARARSGGNEPALYLHRITLTPGDVYLARKTCRRSSRPMTKVSRSLRGPRSFRSRRISGERAVDDARDYAVEARASV